MGFKRLETDDFVVSSDSIVSPVWSDGTSILSSPVANNLQDDNSKDYFLEAVKSGGSEVEFSLAYAHKNGIGATAYDSAASTSASPTSTLYGQLRTLILEDENATFKFDGVNEDESFFIININRARYKEKLYKGSLTLVTTQGTYTEYETSEVTYIGSQRVCTLEYNGSAYGYMLPDTGMILLKDTVLGGFTDLTTALSNITSITLQCEETITSNYVFVRARNSEFNYSENPSFISGTTGELQYEQFIYSPQTYPTTVGLYNDSNELLAVAKMSVPLPKDFTKEALLRVKLDF